MYFPDDDEASWRGLGQEFLDHESRFIRTKMQSPKLGAELHAQLNRHLVERMAHFRQLMSTKKVRAHTHTHTHTHTNTHTKPKKYPPPCGVSLCLPVWRRGVAGQRTNAQRVGPVSDVSMQVVVVEYP
jgi:hypothetical protein